MTFFAVSDRRSDEWPDLEHLFDVPGMRADAMRITRSATAPLGSHPFDVMLPLLDREAVYLETPGGGRAHGVLRYVQGIVAIETEQGLVDPATWRAVLSGVR